MPIKKVTWSTVEDGGFLDSASLLQGLSQPAPSQLISPASVGMLPLGKAFLQKAYVHTEAVIEAVSFRPSTLASQRWLDSLAHPGAKLPGQAAHFISGKESTYLSKYPSSSIFTIRDTWVLAVRENKSALFQLMANGTIVMPLRHSNITFNIILEDDKTLVRVKPKHQEKLEQFLSSGEYMSRKELAVALASLSSLWRPYAAVCSRILDEQLANP